MASNKKKVEISIHPNGNVFINEERSILHARVVFDSTREEYVFTASGKFIIKATLKELRKKWATISQQL